MTSIIKIKSPFVLSELFSFIPKNKQITIIKYNKFLNSKLEIIKLTKTIFFKERIKNYEFNYVEEYLNKFKEDLMNLLKKKNYVISFIILYQKKEF